MKISGIFYWLFIICFAIQFLFSRDWMSLGDNTVLFALMPLIGAAAGLLIEAFGAVMYDDRNNLIQLTTDSELLETVAVQSGYHRW